MTKIFLLLAAIYLLEGCAFSHKTQSIAMYDLGMPSSQTQPAQPVQMQKKSLLIADTTAPVWLDNKSIHYRLLYLNPSQSHSYANSRWIATPAALFAQQLRNRIAANAQEQVIKDSSIAMVDYVLHTELEEFTQLFDSAADSRIVTGLRASLIERNTRKLLAQRNFYITATAPSADATGAVSAFSAASNQLLDELINWLAAALPRNRP